MNTTLLGIDVDSKELVTARRAPAGSPLLQTFANTPTGRQKLVSLLKKATAPGGTIRVCLEATGAYSLEIGKNCWGRILTFDKACKAHSALR